MSTQFYLCVYIFTLFGFESCQMCLMELSFIYFLLSLCGLPLSPVKILLDLLPKNRFKTQHFAIQAQMRAKWDFGQARASLTQIYRLTTNFSLQQYDICKMSVAESVFCLGAFKVGRIATKRCPKSLSKFTVLWC